MNPDGYFDEPIAARYDESCGDQLSPEVLDPIVDFLADLAGQGSALEFGVGTGRVALPLLARGISVSGIELSAAMAKRLREKPHGDSIPITIGDFATAKANGSFGLVYLVFNTIMNLTTQEAQVACFQNAAVHLVPGGFFVIETMLPDLQRLPFGERIRPLAAGEGYWGFDEYDLPNQGLISHHFSIREGRALPHAVPFRYVWPSELDLMAQMTGMTLESRFEDWNRQSFTRFSEKHVSVWRMR